MKRLKSGVSAWVIIAAIAAVVILIVALLLFTNILGGGGEETGAPLNEGDFLEWTYYVGTEEGDPYAITLFTITDVGDTYATVNITYMDAARDVLYYSETHVLKNATFGASGWSQLGLAGYDITLVGTDTLSTKWGPRSAQHYLYTSPDDTTTADIWERNGIFMKMSSTSGETTVTIFLTDTNLSEITNA